MIFPNALQKDSHYKVGVQGSKNQKSLRLCSEAFPSICKASASVAHVSQLRKGGFWSRNAELSSLLELCLVLAFQKGWGRGPGQKTQKLSLLLGFC